MKRITILLCCCSLLATAQNPDTVRIAPIRDNLYFLDCIHGDGGGDVVASIGDEGVLLVDDMFAYMSSQLKAAVRSVSDKPVRMILNTHFHSDHIEGNKVFKSSAIIIGHENIYKRWRPSDKDITPAVTFTDSLTLSFNGEEIKMIHFPHGHTDGDAIVYFTRARVLHLGDMFFFEMFPAVYSEGGGDIKQLIASLDKILARFPPDTKVIPGHGRLATMQDLANYETMLKETTGIVERKMREGGTLEEMKKEKVLAKYEALGQGGAQTTDEYLAMLYKLLSPKKG